ncbi:glycosyltransferase [Rheinheimera sp.]|uniref:glycosyltransferase n=1 Tax=Rheinheimera sp. TaxID=1869214 RepID=UPI00307E3BE1
MSPPVKRPGHTVFLITSLEGGGAEGVCANIASGLADQGMSLELIVLHMHNSVYHNSLSGKVKLTVLGVRQARHAFLPLIRYLNSIQPERVVVFNYELAHVMVLIRPFLRLKFQLIGRNINTFSANALRQSSSLQRFVVNPIQKFLYSRLDHVINQCQAMREDLLVHVPIRPEKTSVIYNAVNRRTGVIAQSAVPKPEFPGYILCVGRLEEQKALHRAVDAFSLIRQDFSGLRLRFLGQGSLEKQLKEQALHRGVGEWVDFLGFTADPVSHYLGARCVLLTSLYEGFPNVLIEAVTLGVPVVSVDCPSGPKEIIQPGVNGILVQGYEPLDISKALYSCLTKVWTIDKIKRTALPYSNAEVINCWWNFLT